MEYNATGFQPTMDDYDFVNETSCIIGSLINGTFMNTTLCGDNVSTTDTANIPRVSAPSNECSDGIGYFRWFSDVVVTPPVVLFGVVGNMLAFIVLCRQKPYLTTTALLRYLAIIDTIILLAAIPLRIVRQIQVCHGVLNGYHKIYTFYIFRWGYPTMYVLRMAGTWLTTFLTVDRHIAVCKPLHAQRIVTNELALGQIIGVTIGSILLSLPAFFEFTIIDVKGIKYFHIRDFARTVEYVISYKVVFWFLVAYIIPIAIMIIFNFRLTMNLRSAAKDRALLQRSVSSDSSRLNNSVTTIVVAVVVTFLVCNSMSLISQTLWSIEKCFPSVKEQLEPSRRYVSTASNLFITINSAVNFLIYCVCSRSFRTTFMREFMCRAKLKISRRGTQGRQSNGSATTNFSLLSNGSNKKVGCSSKENSHYLLSKETSLHNSHKHEHAFHIYG